MRISNRRSLIEKDNNDETGSDADEKFSFHGFR